MSKYINISQLIEVAADTSIQFEFQLFKLCLIYQGKMRCTLPTGRILFVSESRGFNSFQRDFSWHSNAIELYHRKIQTATKVWGEYVFGQYFLILNYITEMKFLLHKSVYVHRVSVQLTILICVAVAVFLRCDSFLRWVIY